MERDWFRDDQLGRSSERMLLMLERRDSIEILRECLF